MRYGKAFMVIVTLLLIILWGVQAGAGRKSQKVPAPIPQTGEIISYFPGDDGDLEMGVDWPVPRFTDHGDGTVRDNLTGLIWLKNANCFGPRTWTDALNDCNSLQNGSCGLTDGSYPGDWRLPNVKELHSLVHFGVSNPALPNTIGTGKWSEGDPFTGVLCNPTNCAGGYYWSSNREPVSQGVYYLYLGGAFVFYTNQTNTYNVWPVRGGN